MTPSSRSVPPPNPPPPPRPPTSLALHITAPPPPNCTQHPFLLLPFSICSSVWRLQAERSLEALYAELVSNGIIKPCPATPLQDYLGTVNFLGATLQSQGLVPDASCAQMRQVLAQYCIYPLASEYCHCKYALALNCLSDLSTCCACMVMQKHIG